MVAESATSMIEFIADDSNQDNTYGIMITESLLPLGAINENQSIELLSFIIEEAIFLKNLWFTYLDMKEDNIMLRRRLDGSFQLVFIDLDSVDTQLCPLDCLNCIERIIHPCQAAYSLPYLGQELDGFSVKYAEMNMKAAVFTIIFKLCPSLRTAQIFQDRPLAALEVYELFTEVLKCGINVHFIEILRTMMSLSVCMHINCKFCTQRTWEDIKTILSNFKIYTGYVFEGFKAQELPRDEERNPFEYGQLQMVRGEPVNVPNHPLYFEADQIVREEPVNVPDHPLSFEAKEVAQCDAWADYDIDGGWYSFPDWYEIESQARDFQEHEHPEMEFEFDEPDAQRIPHFYEGAEMRSTPICSSNGAMVANSITVNPITHSETRNTLLSASTKV